MHKARTHRRRHGQIRHDLPGYTVRPLKDFLSLMTSTNIPGLQTFINAMIALAISIGLLVIFLTMYTTVIGAPRHRRAEVARCGPIFHCSRAAHGICGTLRIWNPCGRRFELCRPCRVSRGIPHFVHPHHAGWILRAAGIALAGANVSARAIRLDGQPKDAVEALSYD